jgi:hypothetical protein
MQLVEYRLGTDLESWLRQRYCVDGMTLDQLAAECGANRATVGRWLHDYGLDRRSMARQAAQDVPA